MNAARKIAHLLEGAYTAFQRVKIQRKIGFGTLAFGFAFLLACFFIPNNVMHFKQIPPSKSFDQSSVFSIMLVYLSCVYPLYFVWLKKKKFTFEQSLTMKLYGCNNKPLLRSFCRYSREQQGFLLKETLVPEGQKENQSKLEKLENIAAFGTMLAGVAHEINNPMTFVNTSAHNLRQGLEKLKTFLVELAGEDIDKDIQASFDEKFDALFEQLDTLKEGTNRIQEIVRNLKSPSQMNNMEMKQVNVQEGIESTLNLVKAGYKYHVDFITDFKPGLEIQGNEGELKQVFMNIIINACHAIVERQKRTGEVTKGRLTIQTWKEADYAAISFQDNGIGMSREVKSRMFEPFFTTKRGKKGTGLGLSISEEIVKENGGEIEVQSMEGKGTTIILYFRLAMKKTRTSPVELKNSEEHLLC